MRSASQTLPKFGAQERSFTPLLVNFFMAKPSAPDEVAIQVHGGPGPGSLMDQSWPKAIFLSSPGITWRLHTANQNSKCLSILWRAEQDKLPCPGVEGEKSQSHHRSGTAGYTEGDRYQHSSAQSLQGRRRLADSGVWRTGRWAGQRAVARSNVAVPAAGPLV